MKHATLRQLNVRVVLRQTGLLGVNESTRRRNTGRHEKCGDKNLAFHAYLLGSMRGGVIACHGAKMQQRT
jgi:hypothetical protein